MVHQVRILDRILFLLFLLQSCSGLNASDEMLLVNASAVHIHLQNGLAMENNHPFTGIVYQLGATQKDTAEIVGFRNGKEHGEWKRFYEGGKLAEKRFFSDGKKTGDYVAWWPNGAKKLDYHFDNGEYNGVCKEWSASGMLLKEMTYKNGYEDGSQKQFYDNGKVKANYVMIADRRYGLLGTKNCVNITDSLFKK